MKVNFENAKKNLYEEYKSPSGMEVKDPYSGWYEMYSDAFTEQLKSHGCVTDEDYSKALCEANQYDGAGSFLNTDGESQVAEMAAFGLILLDRILRGESEKTDRGTLFVLHEGLIECHEYITLREKNGRIRTSLARAGANALHTENRAMKADAFVWLDSHRQNYSSMDDAAIAITKQQPIKFRAARDWVTEWKKLRSASTP